MAARAGTPSEPGLIRDAIAAYGFAAARYAPARIVLWGESLGTGVAIALAAEHDVGRAHSRCALHLRRRCRRRRLSIRAGALADQGHVRSDLRIARVNAPILVLHGERDRVVPIRFGERLFALANEPKRMVRFPDGGHVDLDDHGAVDVVKKFLAQLRS